ncbi:Do family serine endopeptidase [bacterium]|nr:Do family serine endopeptidase [bacterium]
MNNRFGFVALLAVIGVSIVFGVVIGTSLNTPDFVMAAPRDAALPPMKLAPAYAVPGMLDFADIVERAMPAVVSVTAAQLNEQEEDDSEDDQRRSTPDPFRFFFDSPDDDRRRAPRNDPSIGQGSGFIVSADGYILTNNHVVEDADVIRIGTQDGMEYEAELIGTDPSIDLALLKIEVDEELPTLPLGDSRGLRVGQWVIAIGNPLEYEHTVTVGVVSAKERRVPIGTTDSGVVHFIQTDAAINFGNSGGPLLDGAGNVVGINTAIRRANYAEGIGFALPINQARGAMEQLRDKGYVSRGYIGITMNQARLDKEAAEFYGLGDTWGVIVQDVALKGPADRAGIRREDIIRKVNGERVKDNLDLIGKISAHQPGDEIDIELFRDGKRVDVTATLQDRREGLQARNDAGGRRPSRGAPEEEEEPVESEGLGITVGALEDSMRERLRLEDDERGVLVTDVNYESEASEKGIARNMVISSINNESIRDVGDFDRVMATLKPGQPVKLYVLIGNTASYFYLRAPAD